MGGADSEVTAATTRVLLEAAYWDPGSIRRTVARRSGSAPTRPTASSAAATSRRRPTVLDRAAQLMADLGGGAVARGVLDVYPGAAPAPAHRPPARRASSASSARARRARRRSRILQALGFAVDDSGDELQVVVPSFRRDIHQEDDLVEEIVRIWGYDKIPLTWPGRRDHPGQAAAGLRVARVIGRALNAAGLFECVSGPSSIRTGSSAMGWDDPDALIALQNPLSRERSVLRPSLLPGLLEVAGHQREPPDAGRAAVRDRQRLLAAPARGR